MKAIRVGEASLHVRAEGPEGAPTVAFSNSLGTDFRIWDAVIPRLPPGLRVVRYDKRGHGLSDCPGGAWGMREHVADLASLLDALEASQVALVGLSVGGLIAQGLAAERPDLVRSLVLMDTAARIGTREMWDERIRAVEAGGIGAIAEGILERWFTKRFRSEDPAFPACRNMLVRTPAEGYRKTCEAIRDTDFRDLAAALRLPVLAIAGSEDGATPPDLVRDTANRIPGARYLEIPEAGHLPCVERPEAVADALAEFLRETGHV